MKYIFRCPAPCNRCVIMIDVQEEDDPMDRIISAYKAHSKEFHRDMSSKSAIQPKETVKPS